MVVLAAVGFGVSRLVGSGSSGSHRRGSATPPAAGSGGPHRNPTQAENAKRGTTAWKIPTDPPQRAVEGWTSRVSGQPGQRVDLYVTTQAPSFHVEAYRLGYYHGDGGRLIWRSPTRPGKAQPPCPVRAPTTTVDCSGWSKSLTVPVGKSWPPGDYVFKLVAPTGASYVPYTVRDDHGHAPILLVNAVTTWQAYNLWGGHSLYSDINGQGSGRSQVVSFDRPYGLGYAGSAHLFGGTYEALSQIESMGLDVDYTTDVDLDEHPELLRRHRVIISPAHDEYYSLAMRNGLEAARDHGVNLIFLGANAIYRRIRLQPSSIGPDRLEVNYRVAAEDPLNGKDPAQVTTSWREPPDPRPESSLIGDYYECNPAVADLVMVDAGAWMFKGTGITNGEHFPGVVGNEYDRVTPEAPTPKGIQVLAHSPLTCRGSPSFADVSYYTTHSGAAVLAMGSIYFERHLGPLCPAAQLTPGSDCQLRAMIANVLRAFAAGPAGRAHPSHDNLAEFGIHPGYVNAPPGE